MLSFIVLAKTAVVVPKQSAYVVERLGKYCKTLHAGFYIMILFLVVLGYKHTLKEMAIDVPEQICITKDNVQVGVDGVLYLKVLDAERASYGIADYGFAISQLAQTTLRSEIGKIELDRTFEERSSINVQLAHPVCIHSRSPPVSSDLFLHWQIACSFVRGGHSCLLSEMLGMRTACRNTHLPFLGACRIV